MKILTIIRSKWLVKFHPHVDAGDWDWDKVRHQCRQRIYTRGKYIWFHARTNGVEAHIRDRINA